MEKILDIGTLKDRPVELYELCVQLGPDLQLHPAWDESSECYAAIKAVVNSLWAALPPVLTIDFRDPDDPAAT